MSKSGPDTDSVVKTDLGKAEPPSQAEAVDPIASAARLPTMPVDPGLMPSDLASTYGANKSNQHIQIFSQ